MDARCDIGEYKSSVDCPHTANALTVCSYAAGSGIPPWKPTLADMKAGFNAGAKVKCTHLCKNPTKSIEDECRVWTYQDTSQGRGSTFRAIGWIDGSGNAAICSIKCSAYDHCTCSWSSTMLVTSNIRSTRCFSSLRRGIRDFFQHTAIRQSQDSMPPSRP